jgi:nicotinate-nucleotide adenylyltransferase
MSQFLMEWKMMPDEWVGPEPIEQVKRRIGIVGGTFDPPHLGHLLLAEAALSGAGLDEIWFMPTHSPPHKKAKPQAAPAHRRHMLELALAEHPDFRVCDLELKRRGVSYTIDSARALLAEHPDCRFSWVMGADMVQSLPTWVKIEELAELVSFIGVARPGFALDEQALPPFVRQTLSVVPMVALDLSSSTVRDRLRRGQSVRFLLPEAVIRYIEGNDLYES